MITAKHVKCCSYRLEQHARLQISLLKSVARPTFFQWTAEGSRWPKSILSDKEGVCQQSDGENIGHIKKKHSHTDRVGYKATIPCDGVQHDSEEFYRRKPVFCVAWNGLSNFLKLIRTQA